MYKWPEAGDKILVFILRVLKKQENQAKEIKMKSAIFLVILIVASTFADLSPEEADEAWNKYLVSLWLVLKE